MNVHLIRSKKVDNDLYYGVVEYLQHIPGPVNFITDKARREVSINDEVRWMKPKDEEYHVQKEMRMEATGMMPSRTVEMISWNDLFETCRKYRKTKEIPNEDIIVLLTDYGNHANWFMGYDDKQSNNFFVHVDNWDLYVENDARYPIAYHIVTLLLKVQMFASERELIAHFHRDSRGCIMDFCQDKHAISLKMRTADICRDCHSIIAAHNVPFPLMRYTIQMMEDVRKQLLIRERFSTLRTALPLVVKGYMRKLVIPELGNLQINLTPMERAIYLLFLNHPEGIRLAEMGNYKEELKSILNIISRTGDVAVINSGIDELCTYNSNSLSEKVSRIRRKFKDFLGDEMAENYIIKGPNGEIKKIELDRSLVKFVE